MSVSGIRAASAVDAGQQAVRYRAARLPDPPAGRPPPQPRRVEQRRLAQAALGHRRDPGEEQVVVVAAG